MYICYLLARLVSVCLSVCMYVCLFVYLIESFHWAIIFHYTVDMLVSCTVVNGGHFRPHYKTTQAANHPKLHSITQITDMQTLDR